MKIEVIEADETYFQLQEMQEWIEMANDLIDSLLTLVEFSEHRKECPYDEGLSCTCGFNDAIDEYVVKSEAIERRFGNDSGKERD